LRVVIAEDSVLLREGLATLLADAGFDVVARASDADDLLLKVRSYTPDVVITDVRMPPTQTDEGAAAAETIRAEHPEIGVLLLSQGIEVERARRLFSDERGGFGYLLKDRVLDVDEFLEAAERVRAGGTALDPEVVRHLLAPRYEDDPLAELTPREREVLGLMAEGKTNLGIAKQLWLTEKTVETHVSSILGKLRLPRSEEGHRRVLAVLAYLRAGSTRTGS
jgi:DNA-binding NarL/FixJ family response regulator